MSFFTQDDFERLDWRLLQGGCITLYWRSEILDEDEKWLRDHLYQIDSFDCLGWNDMKVVHLAFAETLKFPDYYGNNLDALNDCLSDLDISDATGRVFVFRYFDQFLKKFPNEAWAILDIMAIMSREFLLFGRRLIILIQSNDAKMMLSAVGGQKPIWNSKEWLNSNRGI